MRKIKFRAWDKENKKMVFPLAIRFEIISDKYGYIFNPNFNTKEGVLTSNEYIEPKVVLKEGALIAKDITLMQYTGLRDTDNKEIYEGDICAYTPYWVREVKWEAIDDPEMGDSIGVGYDDCYTYGKVIGNIYENPELLEARR